MLLDKDKKHILKIDSLSASYTSKKILNSISLNIKSGEIICLSGPNGSGKSTLLSILAGLIPNNLQISSNSTTGLPTIDSISVISMPRKQIATKIAYMSQNETYAWNTAVKDVVLTGRYASTQGQYTNKDYNLVTKILELMDIIHLQDRGVYNISGGEFQKVRIARALVQQAEFILLDEPVANLDFGFQNELMSLLVKTSKGDFLTDNKNYNLRKKPGIVISIHELNLAARFADKLALLPVHGKILTGTPSSILTPENISLVYHINAGIFEHPFYKCPQIYQL